MSDTNSEFQKAITQLSLANASLIRMSADHQERINEHRKRMDRLESLLTELPKVIVEALMASLPKAIKREIGFSGKEPME